MIRVGASTERATAVFCAAGSSTCTPGERVPLPLDAVWSQQGATASVDVGVSRRVTAGLTVSGVRARYSDLAGVRTSTGLGDLTARVQSSITSGGALVTALALRVKAPTTRQPSSAQFLRLGDGQWDIDALASIGHSFWPAPAYAFVEGGYRVRTTSHRFTPAINVGDEVPFHVEAGATVRGRVALRARLTGYVGQEDHSGDMTLPGRRLLRAEPSVALRLGRSGAEVELTGSIPLSGRGVPVTRSLRLTVASAPLAY